MTIKIVTKPKVYLIARPRLDGAEVTEFLNTNGTPGFPLTGHPECQKLIEIAARVCYMSFKGGRPHAEHLGHLLENLHGSTLEHANFSFLITGVSRSLTHELVRHRVGWAYSMLSQRYVDESEAEFVIPFHISQDAELKAAWLKSVTEAQRTYQLIADRLYLDGLRKALPSDVWADGEAPESWTEANDVARRLPLEKRTAIRKHARQTARSVLPNCTETKLVATANIRAIRHFLEMRGSVHADYEIRTLAFMIWNIMKDEAPDLFHDFQVNSLPDGQVELVSKHKKV